MSYLHFNKKQFRALGAAVAPSVRSAQNSIVWNKSQKLFRFYVFGCMRLLFVLQCVYETFAKIFANRKDFFFANAEIKDSFHLKSGKQ